MNEANQHAQAFLVEAEELLADIEEAVLDIETDPEDTESVNRLFRAMHTIKGSGAMFGFDHVAAFTHHVETALDRVREKEVPADRRLIDLVLASRDLIAGMLEGGANVPAPPDAQEIISSLALLMAEVGDGGDAAGGADAHGPTEKLADGSVETFCQAPLQAADGAGEKHYRIRLRPDSGIFTTGMDPALLLDDLRELGECRVTVHTDEIPALSDLSPESCHLYWDLVLTTSDGLNAIRDVFIFVEEDCNIRIDEIEAEDTPSPRMGEILVARGDVTSETLLETLGKQKRLGELLVDSGAVSQEKVASALKEQEALASRQPTVKSASVRVPAEKLDRLIDLVGELVVTQAGLTQVAGGIAVPELAVPVEEVERLTAELRDSVLNIRMMPIGATFSRFKRLLRDLSSELGKEIDLVTEGGETELDKTIIERLNDPLVHLIRNSIDHGIETPEARSAAGKSPRGKIRLSAEHRGGNVVISIIDDGAGLDASAIREKAMEKGLVAEDAALSESQAYALIFAPGFSTSASVTSVSGRGVGMDVVKRAIESVGGEIGIESQRGAGTTITLKLPLTLAIIDGLLVTIGDGYFILPLTAVEECVELSEEHRKGDRTRILNIRGEIVPYVRLREHFDITEESPELEHVIIADIGGTRCGFVVDSIIGNHQTVKKSMGPAFSGVKEVSGASILGDGTVALILDVHALV